MEDKEYKAIKRRIAYEEYRAQLPKCSTCGHCMRYKGQRGTVRACGLARKIIDKRVKASPEFCPKRM